MAEKTKAKRPGSSELPKKSTLVRVIVLGVAAIMFLGAIILPFISAGVLK